MTQEQRLVLSFFLNIVIGTTNSLIYYIIVSTGVAIMNYPFYVIAKLQE